MGYRHDLLSQVQAMPTSRDMDSPMSQLMGSTPAPPTFLTLPKEIRRLIFDYASDFRIGSDLVESNKGRLIYRLAWPLSPADQRSDHKVTIDSLAMICLQIRFELLPSIMRGYVVKLPAGEPFIKARCLRWVRGVSESFVRSIDWIWLEGQYWTISIHLVGKGSCRQRTEYEDERIRKLNVISGWYSTSHSQTFEEEYFVARVDYSKFKRAVDFAKRTIALVRDAITVDERGNVSIGRTELAGLLEQTSLTTAEQKRILGVRC